MKLPKQLEWNNGQWRVALPPRPTPKFRSTRPTPPPVPEPVEEQIKEQVDWIKYGF